MNLPSIYRGTLEISEDPFDYAEILYIPSINRLKDHGCDLNQVKQYKTKILWIYKNSSRITIFPIDMTANFLKPKYDNIESITLDGYSWECIEPLEQSFKNKTTEKHIHTNSCVYGVLESLPVGFIKDCDFGLGFTQKYSFITKIVSEFAAKSLVISRDEKTTINDDGSFIINIEDYNQIRIQINVINNNYKKKYQIPTKNIKYDIVYNHLALCINHVKFPQENLYNKNNILDNLLITGKTKLRLNSAPDIIKKVLSNNKKINAEEQKILRVALNKIELCNLNQLIEEFDDRLKNKHQKESDWQKLFVNNPFILSLAFNSPVKLIHGQAHVRNTDSLGKGATVTDFIFKNPLTNNTLILEIKKPSTQLFDKRMYRTDVYSPSRDFAGSINQVLHQLHELTKDFSSRKYMDKNSDLKSYAVEAVLVIGKTPEIPELQKSFDLFRGNLKNISVITFDELLEKLKELYKLLQQKDNSVCFTELS
jgi:hypothetical protein